MVCLAAAVPVGLGAAVFLAEYTSPRGAFGRLVRWSLDVLAGVPSIVFGLFGNAFFCQVLGLGFSILSGGLAGLAGVSEVAGLRGNLGLDLSPVTFMILAQIIIFLLGWPLEWTEIIIIFVPIFLPLLPHFNIDPVTFGILVAINLQTAFLSPPMAMAAFYLKGVAPKSVLLSQIFGGCMPFLFIVLICMTLIYVFPGIATWLPDLIYSR